MVLAVLRLTSLFFLFLFVCIIGILIGLVRPFNPSNSRLYAHTFSYFGTKILGLTIQIEGQEHFPKDRSFIIVANHQSNYDLFTIARALPDRTVSIGKKSLKWIPLFGQLYWLGGNILIDRNNREKAMNAMEVTKRALTQERTNIWFFAEGTRNHGKNMLPFKKGAFVTALDAGVPIIPICCSPYINGFSLKQKDNGVVRIKVLPPIETNSLTQGDIEQVMDDCHQKMLATIKTIEST